MNATQRGAAPSVLDRVLRLGADVRPGEGTTALLLSVAGFLTLASYYTIRPLRSAFLLPVNVMLPGGLVLDGPLVTSYSGAVLAMLFLFIVPAYGALASRVNRMRLINFVAVFFTATLLIFYALGQTLPPAALGIGFYLWVGVFNLMVQAQFWSFANDLYTPEQGKRLFAIVGLGATVGGVAGARTAASVIRAYGEFAPMAIAVAMLLAFMLILNLVNARESGRAPAAARSAEAPLGREGGFQLVLSQPYLLLIGLLTLAIQISNTNGNYILDETLSETARAAAAAGTSAGLSERQFIGAFRADMDFYQNILVVLIQFFLVSRIFKYLGVGGALFIAPAISVVHYGVFAAVPLLAIVRVGKIAENAADYSLQNTLRRALFLPTSREAKYKALQAVETFFWRAGDMLSTATIVVAIQVFGLGMGRFALLNLGVVAIWLVISTYLNREHRRLSRREEKVEVV
jgi:AAA family ATP:ADP antiporter